MAEGTTPPDWFDVRAPGVRFFVLYDREAEGLYLIDTGFWGGRRRLRQELRKRRLDAVPLRGILLTHGHLDHAFNVRPLAEETGAWVAGPSAERRHLVGRFPYRGISRVCGWLEALGRTLLRYRVPDLDTIRWFEPGDRPFDDVWGGLVPVPLPGHSDGHTGYYSYRHRLLFCGDLFATHRSCTHFPPAIFNSCPHRFTEAVRQSLALDLSGICPAHADKADPAEHLRRWRELAARQDRIPR